jgi:hypothetical protein
MASAFLLDVVEAAVATDPVDGSRLAAAGAFAADPTYFSRSSTGTAAAIVLNHRVELM